MSSLPALALALLLSESGVFTTTADRAVSRDTETEELVIDLIGNVTVTDGEVTVTSDSGTVWQVSGDAVFHSNVTVEADTLSGTSQYLQYVRSTGVITMTGDVVLTDGETVLEAQEVVYFRGSGKATAREDVLLTGPDVGSVQGEYALYDRERGSLFVTVDPVMRRVENGDSVTVTADRLEFFPETNSAEAQGNAFVDMPARNFTARSEYLKYMGEEDRFELFGSPEIQSDEGEMSGDWIEIVLDPSGDPEEVRIQGNADGYFLDTGVDPPAETWFSSETAFFSFDQSSPDSVSLSGNATLRMKSGGEAASRSEMNTVRGDNFRISFEDGKAVEVIVFGYVSGTYSYMGN